MPQLSTRVAALQGSPIRAMLNVGNQPGMISFAGGLPSPDSFADINLEWPPVEHLQYGPTEGEPSLRLAISKELSATGLNCPPERILVLSGSQQGIDLVAKLCVDAGTRVAIETPAYLAALQVFRFFGAALEDLDPAKSGAAWPERAPALAYVTPTFQNPTGRCWTLSQRQSLATQCQTQGVLMFEDDPYRDLVYEPCDRQPICSLMSGGSWVYQGSFSKTVAPGLRLGFLAASEDIFQHLTHLKQAADLHTNRLSQWIVSQYLADPARPGRLSALVQRYRLRRDSFADSLRRHLGNHATWQVPAGGLFFWVTLKDGLDSEALLARAVAENVLYTPGRHFYLDSDKACAAMRLNFSHADEAQADAGLAVLGRLIQTA